MSATIPRDTLFSDLLKATGYECPAEFQGKTVGNIIDRATAPQSSGSGSSQESGSSQGSGQRWYAWSLPGAYVEILYTLSEHPRDGDYCYSSYNGTGMEDHITFASGNTLKCPWDASGTYIRYEPGDVTY